MSASAVHASATEPTSADKPARPLLTLPQRLAFVAFAIFVVAAVVSSDTSSVRPDELDEIRKFTLFLIAALLPSDAVIRFGRNLLFQTVEDPDKSASYTPATTPAQWLAFATFVVVVVLTVVSNTVVSAAEFAQVNEVARFLVIALLPSDAAIRFGRALYYRAPTTPQPTRSALKMI